MRKLKVVTLHYADGRRETFAQVVRLATSPSIRGLSLHNPSETALIAISREGVVRLDCK